VSETISERAVRILVENRPAGGRPLLHGHEETPTGNRNAADRSSEAFHPDKLIRSRIDLVQEPCGSGGDPHSGRRYGNERPSRSRHGRGDAERAWIETPEALVAECPDGAVTNGDSGRRSEGDRRASARVRVDGAIGARYSIDGRSHVYPPRAPTLARQAPPL
jgi:hypothetical protein